MPVGVQRQEPQEGHQEEEERRHLEGRAVRREEPEEPAAELQGSELHTVQEVLVEQEVLVVVVDSYLLVPVVVVFVVGKRRMR